MSQDRGIPLRCAFCETPPLLAMFGVDRKTGEPWVHIKSWKGQRLYVEAVILSGIVSLRCRSCARWNRVKIVRGAPRLQENSDHPLDDL